MPDQSVEVTFDPNAVPQFTFVPDVVTMTKAGKVVIHRRPQDAPWKFTNARVKNNTGQFSVDVLGNGSLLHINDAWTEEGRFDYTVTVLFEWNNHTQEFESPDPVIVNDPGSRVSMLVE